MNAPPDYVRGQIYLISSTATDKQYIGQTKSHQWRTAQNAWIKYGYEERFKQHVRNTNTFEKFGRCRALNSAMKLYGADTFRVDLLEECPVDMLDELEIFYIHELSTLSPSGYNLETGGNQNKWASEETRARQSDSRKKYYQSEQGRIFNLEHTRKLHENNSSNNDMKKVERFSGRNIHRIRVAHSPRIATIYIYVYCDGSSERNCLRVKYKDLVSGISRTSQIVTSLTTERSLIESEDLPI